MNTKIKDKSINELRNYVGKISRVNLDTKCAYIIELWDRGDKYATFGPGSYRNEAHLNSFITYTYRVFFPDYTYSDDPLAIKEKDDVEKYLQKHEKNLSIDKLDILFKEVQKEIIEHHTLGVVLTYSYLKTIISKHFDKDTDQQNKQTKKEQQMSATTTIKNETIEASKLVLGEKIYENIEELAHNHVLSKLTWWQKLTISKKQKDLLVLAAIYGLLHAIKTGAFGTIGKSINHPILDMLTLSCNHRIQTKLFANIDTNIVKALLTKPEITETR